MPESKQVWLLRIRADYIKGLLTVSRACRNFQSFVFYRHCIIRSNRKGNLGQRNKPRSIHRSGY